jgi:hypothetical protein
LLRVPTGNLTAVRGWKLSVLGRVALAVALGGIAGCGGGKTFVSAIEEHELPTQQLSAGQELCPDRDLPHAERLASKRKAHRHVEALLRALRRHPDAYVHTTYASSDEGPGNSDLTVRALVQQWARFSYCAPATQHRLQAALAAEQP